jgi:glycosyltransferase involved in cell wall biosynthesis
VIARDAEHTLRRCLESTAWAEESVVVVDAMSADDTEGIAREMGARVLIHPYEGTIEQKNFALEQTQYDWILALDADEAVSEPLGREIAETLARDGESFVGYVLRRGFLEGIPGFLAAAVTAFYVFLKYAKLWELTRVGRAEDAEGAGPGSKPDEATR